ncbi:hypothetical protein BHM03_00032879 [Ensete ventricosum]|nr:hypothetical protein BHM03_00032879 [Ensete ventricosum]
MAFPIAVSSVLLCFLDRTGGMLPRCHPGDGEQRRGICSDIGRWGMHRIKWWVRGGFRETCFAMVLKARPEAVLNFVSDCFFTADAMLQD